MEYISVKAWAEMHGVSERTARNYCAQNKIDGAYLIGKTWNMPADAQPPKRSKKNIFISFIESVERTKGQ